MKFEVIEYQERFLCCVKVQGLLYGEIFEAKTHEQVFAWLQLVMGTYPGSFQKLESDDAA